MKVLLEPSPALETLDALGIAARELMDALLTDESLASALAPQAIAFVTRTYLTDPEGSRQRLASLFEPGRFSRIGHVEVPWLAREIRVVTAADPVFAIEIYSRVFSSADFDHTQETSMGDSWILSMRSNAWQDFNMARYHLAEAYRGILESDPAAGGQILAVTLEGEKTHQHRYDDDKQPQCFTVVGHGYSVIEDWSHIWAWNMEEENTRDDYAKIVRAFLGWIPTAPRAQQDSAVEALLHRSSLALAWRCTFIAGASQPVSLGLKLWPFVTRPEFLFLMDTRQSSISLIAAIYQNQPIQERETYETEAEKLDFSSFKRPEDAKSEVLSCLYAAIGKENLVTNVARERLNAVLEQGLSLENKRPFEVTTSWGVCEPHDWICGNTSNSPNSGILALNDQVDEILSSFKTSPTPDGLAKLATGIQELDRLVESLRSEQLLADVDCTASDTLAKGAMAVLNTELCTEAYQDDFIKLLLRLSEHPLPEARPDTEANFAKSPSWGCPCPRIHAAEAIASIMALPGVWSKVSDAVERLTLHDEHPAVRMKIITELSGLWKEQRNEMWRFVDAVSRQEKNSGVIQYFLHVLWLLRSVESIRVETLYLHILDRITFHPKSENGVVDLLVYFAIVKNDSMSRTRLHDWVSKFEENGERLQAALHRFRDLVVLGYEDIKNGDVEIGERARALVVSTIDKLEPTLRAWSSRGNIPTHEEQIACNLLGTITDLFFYGTGAGKEGEVIKTHAGQAAFLRDNSDAIRRITQLGTPYSVHHMLELLGAMVPADPALCFDLISDALLRPAGIARYEYETLGADLFVKLVGQYLADYRGLFSDDSRRRRLVDCIEVFVEAGWSEARRLFQSLPELLS
ncbi:hypothetical protein F6R98_20010 [Candidatus Methylospira mobilis]|uniref:Uncharacterized protein n=1 Tax=Candidatus Methylospira mobilis TaxID=1808979 RepID=A0A5Q0BLZ7_9GAMM|nr:hypothetical protein [Candidatus Methylospira mobilis]QFY44629.1 hypothetical protein F6R98_20010 [Candidatus Methylospira mobilis]